MVRRVSAAIVLCIWLTGCGYVGDPLPPALNIPQRVIDLRAFQRGGTIIIDYTVPLKTTEDLPLKNPGPPDLQIADKVVEAPGDKGHVEVPAKDWVGQDAVVRLRVNNGRGRYSDWSNSVTLSVVPALDPPSGVIAKSDPKGLRLSWGGKGEKWRVVRLADSKVSVVDQPEFIDADAAFGKEQRYQVIAWLKTAESEPSAPIAFTPKDEFPPAMPAGLTALAGIDSVELSWDRNTEEDLTAYRLYRAVDVGAFEPIAQSVEAPSYSDKTVMPGKKYKYAVSALDQSGNESPKSMPVEIATPQ